MPAVDAHLDQLHVDGAPATLLGTLAGSNGEYTQTSEGRLAADQWNLRLNLTPAAALQGATIDASALTLNGAFIVGNPSGTGGFIRQYLSSAATKITQKESYSLVVTKNDGKLDLLYSISLTAIPSDGQPAKRFVLNATGLPL